MEDASITAALDALAVMELLSPAMLVTLAALAGTVLGIRAAAELLACSTAAKLETFVVDEDAVGTMLVDANVLASIELLLGFSPDEG